MARSARSRRIAARRSKKNPHPFQRALKRKLIASGVKPTQARAIAKAHRISVSKAKRSAATKATIAHSGSSKPKPRSGAKRKFDETKHHRAKNGRFG